MQRKLPRTVIVLGLVSFLNDMASEMVTPFIPILIATVLGAGPVILGLVEGMADAVASFSSCGRDVIPILWGASARFSWLGVMGCPTWRAR